MSSSQRTGRTSRNHVFHVASASWARRAELPVSQRSAASEGSDDDTSAVEPGSKLSTSPSTSVEKRREGCENPSRDWYWSACRGRGAPRGRSPDRGRCDGRDGERSKGPGDEQGERWSTRAR